MRLLVALALLSCGACGVSAQPAPVAEPPDLIVHHAVVYTVNEAAPRAEAVAIRGGRFVFVGRDAGLGEQLWVLDLRGTASLAEVVAKVAARAKTTAADTWVVGRGWDQNDWPDKAWPTRAALEAAARARRVWLTRVDGHAGLASSRGC